jgi:hypothetical protein
MSIRVKDLTVDQVRSVYSGRADHCACGCAGTHRYNSKHIDEATKDRGYQVRLEDINDKQIARVLNVIKKEAGVEEYIKENYVSVDVGNRMYIVYLTNATQGSI